MSEEKSGNFLDQLNKSFTDFVERTFGESGKEFVEETSSKIKEFSSASIKKFMEFSDSVLESLNLKDNEQVMKLRDSVEDMLKQGGLLKDDDEEEF